MRIAIARPKDHPLALVAREAGWEPLHYPVTRNVPNGAPPPVPMNAVHGLVLLSPTGAKAVKPWLSPYTTILVDSLRTAEALGTAFTHLHVAEEETPESLWDLIQETYPGGGELLMVRAERSRGFLEDASRGSSWHLRPWVTHREVPADPMPELPPVDAVLALSPLQAELLAPRSAGLRCFAWEQATAKAFEAAGLPVDGCCEPRLDALRELLAGHVCHVVG